MHSHPSPGWQGMSDADIEAERDVLAYPAGATGLPLVGLTVGVDGQWSARFWERQGAHMRRRWCEKTRVVGPDLYQLHFNDELVPAPARLEILRRTFDTWGPAAQNTIARLHVGIVGLGSVGCLVAEAIARMGVGRVTLIDPDRIEEHNLDRLLYGTVRDIGRLKVDAAAEAMRRNATANNIDITPLSAIGAPEISVRVCPGLRHHLQLRRPAGGTGCPELRLASTYDPGRRRWCRRRVRHC